MKNLGEIQDYSFFSEEEKSCGTHQEARHHNEITHSVCGDVHIWIFLWRDDNL